MKARLPSCLFHAQACRRPFRHNRLPVYSLRVNLSVVLITYNEESNLARTLASVQPMVREGTGEIVVVDSGSTDRTVEIARSFGARVFAEEWKGYSAQKNSAIEKASGDWILSLDADEELNHGAAQVIERILGPDAEKYATVSAVWFARKNHFLGRWIRHGGFYPDRKLRLFRRGQAMFSARAVHETVSTNGRTLIAEHDFSLREDVALIHHSYPTLSDYIDHMNRYSSLGAEMIVAEGRKRFSVMNIAIRPWFTFFYNYFLRLGFLDGREGLLLHLYHAIYVSWKYAKAWELRSARKP
ncbi:MAG TPA: glycosyltransferase family 2 protein [Terriglobales bacterium]|nr:glycosyltransferase family 2 protein [Terriglobales bacterium]